MISDNSLSRIAKRLNALEQIEYEPSYSSEGKTPEEHYAAVMAEITGALSNNLEQNLRFLGNYGGDLPQDILAPYYDLVGKIKEYLAANSTGETTNDLW